MHRRCRLQIAKCIGHVMHQLDASHPIVVSLFQFIGLAFQKSPPSTAIYGANGPAIVSSFAVVAGIRLLRKRKSFISLNCSLYSCHASPAWYWPTMEMPAGPALAVSGQPPAQRMRHSGVQHSCRQRVFSGESFSRTRCRHVQTVYRVTVQVKCYIRSFGLYRHFEAQQRRT